MNPPVDGGKRLSGDSPAAPIVVGMRRFLAVLLALGLALAEGWVLPFEGPGGLSDAYAVAQALSARDPVYTGLFLPEPPWREGWRLTLTRLATPGGVRMAAEASGADWVLAAWKDTGGLYHAALFDGRQSHRAVVGSAAALLAWASTLLDRPTGPLNPRPGLEPVLRLALKDPRRAAQKAPDPELAQRLNRYADGLEKGRLGFLPRELRQFWYGFHHPQAMPESGMGLVWRAFLAHGRGPEVAKLAQSPLLLHQTAAVLLLHDRGDPRWRELARRLPAIEPGYAWGYEMESFAAFEENRPQEARAALLKAVRLAPEKGLYWTNLGWAYYLTGDRARARLASLHALKLEENPTAHYNLGLLYALWRAYYPALAHYRRAVAMDRDWEIRSAIQDLKDAGGDPELAYWRGRLLAYAGEVAAARRAYRHLLAQAPGSPLAPWARRGLNRLSGSFLKLAIQAVSLRPDGPPQDRLGAGEPVWVRVALEADPALPATPLVVEVKGPDGRTVRRATFFEDRPPYPPNTVSYAGWVGPLEALPRGRYRLVARLGGVWAERALAVGVSNLARRFYALGALPRDPDGLPLVEEDDLLAPKGEERLVRALLEAVHRAAPLAAKIAPYNLAKGHQPSVAERMARADDALVRAYLKAALADPELLRPNAVEGFARWLLGR